MLPEATLPHIRKIRAINFIRKSEEREERYRARKAKEAGKRQALCEISPNQNKVSPQTSSPVKPQESDEENLYQLPATTYCHQRTRTLLSSSHKSPLSEHAKAGEPSITAVQPSSGGSSQQEFTEVVPSLLDPEIDPSLLLSFEMLSPGQSSSEQGPSLRGGQGEVITLQQVQSSQETPVANRKSVLPSSSPLPRVESSPFRVFTPGSSSTPVKEVSTPAKRAVTEPQKLTRKNEKHGTPEHDKPTERLRKLSDSLRPSRRPIADSFDPSRRIRAGNRQVRIVDGVLLNPKTRKRLSSPPSTTTIDEEGTVNKVVRRSLTPVWQRRDSSRQSWMKIMRNFFRTEANSSQGAKSSKRESSNHSQPTVALSTALPSHHTDEHTPATEPERLSYPLGLDGVMDPRLFVSRDDLDRNKPLPLSPGEIVRSLSTNADMRTSLQPRNPATLSRAVTSADLRYDTRTPASDHIKPREVPAKHQLLPVYELEDTSSKEGGEPEKIAQVPLS